MGIANPRRFFIRRGVWELKFVVSFEVAQLARETSQMRRVRPDILKVWFVLRRVRDMRRCHLGIQMLQLMK